MFKISLITYIDLFLAITYMNFNLKYWLVVLLFGMALIAPTRAEAAPSAREVLDKAVAKLSKASSVNCAFSITSGNERINGSFKSSGHKFKLESPVGITWYDGKIMWTSNKKSKEITLVNPSSQEVNEVNPFAYLNSWKSKYRIGFSRRKDNSNYLVVLNPIDPADNVKAVEVTVDKKTFLPKRFIIRDKNDRRTTVMLSSLTLQAKNPDNTYVCPVERMADYEVVDLR